MVVRHMPFRPEDQTSVRPTAPPGAATSAVLDRLWATIEARRGVDPATSYTASLLARHPVKPAQKLAEEAAECTIEAVLGRRDNLVRESADLLYHLCVLLAGAGLAPGDVFGELSTRMTATEARARGGVKRVVRRRVKRKVRGTTKIP